MLNNRPISIHKLNQETSKNRVYLIEKGVFINDIKLEAWQEEEIKTQETSGILTYRDATQNIFIVSIDSLSSKENYKSKEETRKSGANLLTELKKIKATDVIISSNIKTGDIIMALVDGLILANYQFLTYKTDKKVSSLSTIYIDSSTISANEIATFQEVLTGTYFARTFVNEPVITLSALRFSEEISALGALSGFDVKVLHKKDIEALGMGGLLSVNLGSKMPPTFNILEYKSPEAKNKKPIVLVGKGIMYDTGGLSLKPTPGSMDSMKSDMAGAAAVVGTFHAIAKNKLPIHIIGLIPATDNRPGEDAYTPGDVITLHNGKTVEVLNTDAEGRLVLGDALSYASQYDPELVLDLATLTGAQVLAIGSLGAAIMGTASENDKKALIRAGEETYERVAEMPFWDEYGDMVKSDIADLKNVAGREGGCITAGKFLENFTNYPWIHIDIAGPSFLNSNESYKLKGGTGYGVKLLYQFLKSKI